MQSITLYTDGGCHGNPGPGAWAYVLIVGDTVETASGYEPATTNNRMELNAVIQGLRHARATADGNPAAVSVHTDSVYVKNGINDWIHRWKRNGWKTAAKQPVKNRELWQELDEVNSALSPKWSWVPGHAGVHYNEVCDQLVQKAIAEAGGK